MPGSPDEGIVNAAACPFGTSFALPSSVPFVVEFDGPDVGAVVVGEAPVGTVNCAVAPAAGFAPPIALPTSATAPPRIKTAAPSPAATAPPMTSARRSTESIDTRVTNGARSPSKTGQTALSQASPWRAAHAPWWK